MKKILVSLFVIILNLAIIGCRKAEPKKSTLGQKVYVRNINIGKSNFIKIEKIMPHKHSIDLFLSTKNYRVSEINWDKTRLNGNHNFKVEKAYIDVNKSLADNIILPNDEGVYTISSKNITYPAKITLCVNQESVEEFVTIEIIGRLK